MGELGDGQYFSNRACPGEGRVNTPKLVLALLDEAYERKTWHGPNLKQSLKGVSMVEAAWRPGPGRHNIWEVALHAAYWKHEVRRRITGGKRERFPLKGHNWFAADDGSWPAAVRLLLDEHRALRAAVAALPSGALRRRVRGRDTAAFTI